MTSSTLIIPDIHGRTFWRTPVLAALNDPQAPDIVFLGDYLDPYTYEGVTPSEAYCIFSEILNLKREHPHRIHLLLGNHDIGAGDGGRELDILGEVLEGVVTGLHGTVTGIVNTGSTGGIDTFDNFVIDRHDGLKG